MPFLQNYGIAVEYLLKLPLPGKYIVYLFKITGCCNAVKGR